MITSLVSICTCPQSDFAFLKLLNFDSCYKRLLFQIQFEWFDLQ
jgi:hypothetical protein